MPNNKNQGSGNSSSPLYLLHQAGLIQTLANNNYLWLPLGIRVLTRIKAIVHEEIFKEGGLAIHLPGQDIHERQQALVELMRQQTRSYKQLPRIFYQEGEIYFFHLNSAALEEIYQMLLRVWQRIFLRLKLATSINGCYRQEEIPINILLANGKAVKLQMGCYQLHWLDLVCAIVDQHHDEFGIIWPENIAPFQIGIIPLHMQKSYRVRAAATRIYQQLQSKHFTVLMDDRKERPGLLFADMDLLGIPHRLVITERGLDAGIIEYKSRNNGEIQLWQFSEERS